MLKLPDRDTGRERAVFAGEDNREDEVGRGGGDDRISNGGGVEVFDAAMCDGGGLCVCQSGLFPPEPTDYPSFIDGGRV